MTSHESGLYDAVQSFMDLARSGPNAGLSMNGYRANSRLSSRPKLCTLFS